MKNYSIDGIIEEIVENKKAMSYSPVVYNELEHQNLRIPITNMLRDQQEFYGELERLISWKETEVPKSSDYGVLAQDWVSHENKSLKGFSHAFVPSFFLLNYFTEISPVFTVAVGSVTVGSFLYSAYMRKKNSKLEKYPQVQDFIVDLSRIYAHKKHFKEGNCAILHGRIIDYKNSLEVLQRTFYHEGFDLNEISIFSEELERLDYAYQILPQVVKNISKNKKGEVPFFLPGIYPHVGISSDEIAADSNVKTAKIIKDIPRLLVRYLSFEKNDE